MLAGISGVESERPYLSLEKEKGNVRVVFTNSIKRARKIKKFHVVVVQ